MKFFKVALITTFIITSFSLSLKATEEFTYDPKNNRDPFIPLIGPDGEYFETLGDIESLTDLVLEGIIWDPEGESLAIINGEILKEGDNLDGFKIKRIFADKVIILVGDEEFTLNLISEEEESYERPQDLPNKDFGSF